MKFPVLIILLVAVPVLCVPVFAEEYVSGPREVVLDRPGQDLPPNLPFAVLTLSSIHEEIRLVKEKTAEEVQQLLDGLASATTEEEAVALVRRIERVEFDQTLSILKIQIKHARKAGQFELVRRLQKEVGAMLENQIQVAASEVR
ncbi:MAG: hypothetical protein ABIK96_04470 [bacterium]